MTHVPDALPEHAFTLKELRMLRDAMGAYQATLAVEMLPYGERTGHMLAPTPVSLRKRAAKKQQLLFGELVRAKVMYALRRLEQAAEVAPDQ